MKAKKGHEIDELIVIKLFRNDYARDLIMIGTNKQLLNPESCAICSTTLNNSNTKIVGNLTSVTIMWNSV